MTGKLAYVMSRFPHLPETFILREMTEMRRQGWRIGLYPLIHQKQEVVHAQAKEWIDQAVYSPMLSGSVVRANLRLFVKRPKDYLGLWMRVVRENLTSPNFLVRAIVLLPKAVYMAKRMERDGVTHIHAHYATHPALAAWIIHRLTGIGYSVTVHAHDIFVRQAMLATKLRSADFIVAISEYNRQFLADLLGSWVQEKTHVIHCGIEPTLYTPIDGRDDDRTEFEILNIGSLQPYKGHLYLIEACALLRARGVPFRCRIIGGGSQAELRRLIIDHGVDGFVELLGPQDEQSVARYLASADCYVQPSIVTPSGKMEGIPVSLMEALAARRPVVATSISGVPELVQPGKTGYLVPPADALSLADALEYVYCHPTQAASLAAAGRRLVLEEFDLQTNVRRLGDLLRGETANKTHLADHNSLVATVRS